MKNYLKYYTTAGIKKYLSEVLVGVKVGSVSFDYLTGKEICVMLDNGEGIYDFRCKYDNINKLTLEQLAVDIMLYNKENGYVL